VARSFLRARATLVVGTLLLACGVSPLASADGHGSGHGLQERKHRVEHRIEGARQDLDESSGRLRHATATLLTARSDLSRARAHLADTRGQLAAAAALDRRMQERLAAAEQRLRQARADVDAEHRKIAGEQRFLGEIVVSNYQSGAPQLMGLSMVLTSQDPAELTNQLTSVQNVMDKQSVVLDRLEASRALLTVQEEQVRAAEQVVARQRRAAAANLARKRTLESAAETAAAQVRHLVEVRTVARRRAERAEAADLAELRGLQREQERIAAVLRRRAAAARARSYSSGAVHSDGFLDYPVNGPVTSPFGWRIHPIYGYRSLHDGVDFGVACGTPIRAAADGTVVERYYQTAWGNRVVIDHGLHHGVSLATITNHMNAPAIVSPGQHVHRGQVVGYVGTTGWSTGCHLHFTVMQNGTAVNPMNWF
jgi:murein DD-endopeptidase MepM/ murein hydrolase activator NlpD